jgi:hypothetical protein
MKSDKRKKIVSGKAAAKEHRLNNPGFKSNYARKKAYLYIHGGFGFDYPDKPWR